jgi:hypothetical protein
MKDDRGLDDKVQQTQSINDDSGKENIGTGKTVGIYGCGLLLLGLLIVLIALVLTGIFNPFEGTEGVGP